MLPKVAIPEYTITLPSLNKKIKIRPYMAKEEKILLSALEDKNDLENSVKQAIKQIIENCVITKLDIDTLPRVDIETILLNIRKRSVGETVDLEYDARELFDCKEKTCLETLKYRLPLDSFEVVNNENMTTKVMLNTEVGVVLHQMPLFAESDDSGIDKIFNMIAKTIDKIFTNDDVIEVSKMPASDRLELPNWIENSFDRNALNAVMEFISNQPSYRSKFELKCSVCGKTKEVEVDGIIDFFT